MAVFAAGEQAAEARSAGAEVVGADDLVARIQTEGFLDFDVAIATPDLMGQVGSLGRVLGPRGLMPNPKTGTVTMDVGRAVTEFKGGRVEYRTDKVGNIHIRVGKVSFSREQLMANIHAVDRRALPGQAAGRQGPLPAGGHPVVHHGAGHPHRPGPCPRGGRRAGPGRLSPRRRPFLGRRLVFTGRFATPWRSGPKIEAVRRRPPVHRGCRRGSTGSPPDEAIRIGRPALRRTGRSVAPPGMR